MDRKSQGKVSRAGTRKSFKRHQLKMETAAPARSGPASAPASKEKREREGEKVEPAFLPEKEEKKN